MIRSIALEFHWHPDQISCFYLDKKDEFSLYFWYDFICEINKKIKKE